jgi:hypothetical protein
MCLANQAKEAVMSDDSQWERFKPHATRQVNSTLPVTLADSLDLLLYLLKRGGYKIDRSQIISRILTAFFQSDHVWARMVRENHDPK